MGVSQSWAFRVFILSLAVAGGGSCGLGCGDGIQRLRPDVVGASGELGTIGILVFVLVAPWGVRNVAAYFAAVFIGILVTLTLRTPLNTFWCALGDGDNCVELAVQNARDGDVKSAARNYRRGCLAGDTSVSPSVPPAARGCFGWAGIERANAAKAMAELAARKSWRSEGYERLLRLALVVCDRDELPERIRRQCDDWSSGESNGVGCSDVPDLPEGLCLIRKQTRGNRSRPRSTPEPSELP